jgi:hypothetical protein
LSSICPGLSSCPYLWPTSEPPLLKPFILEPLGNNVCPPCFFGWLSTLS